MPADGLDNGAGSRETGGAEPGGLVLRLEGFEGPLDLLLELARGQKVDLAKISILSLVEQFLAVVEGARAVRLELAADWLVMAAWLAWLKSRLLLPASPGEAEEGELAGEALAERLAHLQAMQRLAAWLGGRPQLGQEVFVRGAPEDFTEYDRSGLKLDVAGLVAAYLGARRRGGGRRLYRPRPVTFWSVKDALGRLERLVGRLPDWTSLEQFIPPEAASPLERKAAMASTLIAGLELARNGVVRLRQEAPFSPILLRDDQQSAEDGEAGHGEDGEEAPRTPDDAEGGRA